jgi:hypothetical protein
MTAAQRTGLSLSAADAGMMVYQTDLSTTPKGLYHFDGISWQAPIVNGSSNGQTLRWTGSKWEASNYWFNTGSAIGLGISAPNVQFQIHSNNAPTSRLQITSGTGNGLATDGLILGITQTSQYAHLIQLENKPLWFGTNNTERV